MSNLLCLASFVGFVVVISASYPSYEGGYGYDQPGLTPVANGYAAPYRNDLRQEAVNRRAAQTGGGVGTAPLYGVPGTGLTFDARYQGYGGYGYGNRHGYGGYGGGRSSYGGQHGGYGGQRGGYGGQRGGYGGQRGGYGGQHGGYGGQRGGSGGQRGGYGDGYGKNGYDYGSYGSYYENH